MNTIDNIKSMADVTAAIDLINRVFKPDEAVVVNQLSKWQKWLADNPKLLLCAKSGNSIIAVVAGFVDGGGITAGVVAVDDNYQKQGTGEALMRELENRAKSLGYHTITLGSVETAENFYARLGYTGSLLIQSEQHSIDELKAVNGKYEVLWTNIYDSKINQVCLKLPEPDRELQRLYETSLLGCHTQMMFQKNI
jgi:GNAT superfamily N-acetyltransferase